MANASPRFFSAPAAVLLVAVATGCGSSSAQDACEQIVLACHPVDPGSGPVHDCHEFAENTATTEAMCATRLDECRTTCAAAGDAGHD